VVTGAELRGHRLGYPAEVAMALVGYLQGAAANRPGLQQDDLAARCLELTAQPPPRHLRAVQ
jgi:hypothetical protein